MERKKKHHLYLENNVSFRKCEVVDSVNTGPGSSKVLDQVKMLYVNQASIAQPSENPSLGEL